MRQLNVSKITGYKITDPYKPVVIRDFRGVLFYSTESLLPKVKEFNLPPGTYFVDSGYFVPMQFPVWYNLVKLPFPQRLLPAPKDFTVCFGYNPNKCTIFWDDKVILFDDSFREKPLPEIYFIKYHEFGHAKYKDEYLADLYAANSMLKNGFNIWQTGMAPIESLSDQESAMRRKSIIVNELLKANKL